MESMSFSANTTLVPVCYSRYRYPRTKRTLPIIAAVLSNHVLLLCYYAVLAILCCSDFNMLEFFYIKNAPILKSGSAFFPVMGSFIYGMGVPRNCSCLSFSLYFHFDGNVAAISQPVYYNTSPQACLYLRLWHGSVPRNLPRRLAFSFYFHFDGNVSNRFITTSRLKFA